MGVDFSKSSHLWFFIGLIPLVSWFSSHLFFNFFTNWPNWLYSPTPLFIYAGLYYLFNKYLWKMGIFRTLGIVWFPNLNGRWIGKQRSSHKEGGTNIEVEGFLEIKQSFSKVNLQAYFEKSKSESTVATFSELNNEVYLFFTYDNDPSSLRSGTMERHKGTAKIKKLPKENRLTGSYWNSIRNYGEMDYELEQKDLLGRY